MPRTTLTLVLCAVIALGAGAAGSWLTRAKAGVAIVDLDRVVKELGRDTQMAGELIGQQNTFQKQLAAVQNGIVDKLTKMKDELGTEPAPEKLQEFNKTKQQLQLQYNGLHQQAITKIGLRREQLVGEFRDEARPVAEQIAKSIGATTVMTRTDSVLTIVDDAIDITDQVIEQMKANPTKPAAKATGAVAKTGDSNVRQASATTTKPAPKATAPAKAPAVKAEK